MSGGGWYAPETIIPFSVKFLVTNVVFPSIRLIEPLVISN
jgi:hypothetical protein